MKGGSGTVRARRVLVQMVGERLRGPVGWKTWGKLLIVAVCYRF